MNIMDSLNALRRDYDSPLKLDEKSADANPYSQFCKWFDDAVEANFLDVNAMVLSTANKAGQPSSRVVLLKNHDEIGYVFFTNFDSKKGNDLKENPFASILFFWDKLERQIRIEGKIEKISDEESYEYFKTREYTSRLGAWASEQSRPLSSRYKLMRKVVNFMTKFPKEVPLPPYWGGFRLIPDYYEFWQGRKSRLHDRITYHKENNIWLKQRIYP